MRAYDVAIVGAGGIAKAHIDAYTAHPERVRIVAVCDPDEQARLAAAASLRVPARASVAELVAEDAFDVGVVCTPTGVRETVVNALAAAGRHVFVEKPLADNLPEAERMVQACDEAGVLLAVDQNFRTLYGFDRARALVSEGAIGPVLTVSHHELMLRRDRGWRTDRDRHVLCVMGVHWLDGFRRMLSSEAASVSARVWSSPLVEGAGETDVVADVDFECGTRVSYVDSFSSAFSRTGTVAVGERGALTLDFDAVTLWTPGEAEPAGRWENPGPGSGFGFGEQIFIALDNLLRALDDGTVPPNGGHDNLRTIALIESAYRSAAEGRPVMLREGRPV